MKLVLPLLPDRGLHDNNFFIASRAAGLAAKERGGAPVHALSLRPSAALAPRAPLSHGIRILRLVLRLVGLALSGPSASGHPCELHGLWYSGDGLAACQGLRDIHWPTVIVHLMEANDRKGRRYLNSESAKHIKKNEMDFLKKMVSISKRKNSIKKDE